MNTPNQQLTRQEFLKRIAQVTVAAPFLAHVGEAQPPHGPRISYCCNGQIHVNEVGQPERTSLTPGKPFWDFKPSWSKTGNHLVCFRRLKDDPVVVNWKSAIFIINTDGTGFHTLTDGKHTDFNPTWTRDGLNTPIWNRKNEKGAGFQVMQSKVGGEPGEEVAITDPSFHNWGHSCLMDGRIVVAARHPTMGLSLFLLARREGGKPLYERVQCELTPNGSFARLSVSPSEKKVCFEFMSFERQREIKGGEAGHTLYVADFDVRERTITNLKPFANKAGKKIWFAYARWIDGESAVVYHSGETGHNQLYVYRLDDGSIKRVSTNPTADYRYPHGESAPC